MRSVIMAVSLMLVPIMAGAETLSDAITISASGMRVQSNRLRVVAQNVANADSTGLSPGADPYRRKTIFFKPMYDPKTGVEIVGVSKYDVDPGEFPQRYDPTHPAANLAGYVKLPNVDSLVEAQDAKEAQRSYEANLNLIDVSRNMLTRTIDILR